MGKNIKTFMIIALVFSCLFCIKGYILLFDYCKDAYIATAADIRQGLINLIVFLTFITIIIVYLMCWDSIKSLHKIVVYSFLFSFMVPGWVSVFVFTKLQTGIFLIATVIMIHLLSKNQQD